MEPETTPKRRECGERTEFKRVRTVEFILSLEPDGQTSLANGMSLEMSPGTRCLPVGENQSHTNMEDIPTKDSLADLQLVPGKFSPDDNFMLPDNICGSFGGMQISETAMKTHQTSFPPALAKTEEIDTR